MVHNDNEMDGSLALSNVEVVFRVMFTSSGTSARNASIFRTDVDARERGRGKPLALSSTGDGYNVIGYMVFPAIWSIFASSRTE